MNEAAALFNTALIRIIGLPMAFLLAVTFSTHRFPSCVILLPLDVVTLDRAKSAIMA